MPRIGALTAFALGQHQEIAGPPSAAHLGPYAAANLPERSTAEVTSGHARQTRPPRSSALASCR
jgi:hypothetical protein